MKLLTSFQEAEILEKYATNKYNCKSLSREMGVHYQRVYNFLRGKGIKITNLRKTYLNQYQIDEHFFDIIDTEAKAYFLGLLYADGCNSEERGIVTINLQDTDRHILEIFKKELKADHPLLEINRKNKNKNCQNQVRLAFLNKRISEKLSFLGCTARKSLTLKFPPPYSIPDLLMHHFIRGVHDGDGYFGEFTNNKGYHTYGCRITSTENFCNSLSDLLFQRLQIKTCVRKTLMKKGNNITAGMDIQGRIQIFKFLEWIYKDATIFLQRKFDRFTKAKDNFQIRYNNRKTDRGYADFKNKNA